MAAEKRTQIFTEWDSSQTSYRGWGELVQHPILPDRLVINGVDVWTQRIENGQKEPYRYTQLGE